MKTKKENVLNVCYFTSLNELCHSANKTGSAPPQGLYEKILYDHITSADDISEFSSTT